MGWLTLLRRAWRSFSPTAPATDSIPGQQAVIVTQNIRMNFAHDGTPVIEQASVHVPPPTPSTKPPLGLETPVPKPSTLSPPMTDELPKLPGL